MSISDDRPTLFDQWLPAAYAVLAGFAWWDFATTAPDGLANIGLMFAVLPVTAFGLALGWAIGSEAFPLLLRPWIPGQKHAGEHALRPRHDGGRSHSPAELDRALEMSDGVGRSFAEAGQPAEQQGPRSQALSAADVPHLFAPRDAIVEHGRVLAVAQRDAERGETAEVGA